MASQQQQQARRFSLKAGPVAASSSNSNAANSVGPASGLSSGAGKSAAYARDALRTSLRDEQERVQKKTFTNWINTYLIQCQPPCKISDLFPEIKDGIKLLLLLEVLSGQKLPQESRKPMQRVHCLSNIRTALSFLESKNIKLVNINPADIVDGKPAIVLGLIWTIILYFQIEEQEDTIMKSLEGTELAERGEKFKGSAKKALLAWAQNHLGEKYSIDIKDFGNSWRDGSAFNAMVHNIDPSLVDMENLAKRSNRENLEAAFAAAESGLNIPRLIDPEDVDVDKPDEKSIMTYVAQFLKAYPEGSKKKPKLLEQMEDAQSKVEAAKQAAEQERSELRKISDFCEAVERELPSSTGRGRGDPADNYKKFEEFRQQQRALTEPYEVLLKRRADGHLLSVKPEEVDNLRAQWLAASDRLNEWRWQLDSALPGDLGKVGGWLARAERCLWEPFPDTSGGLSDEEAAQTLHRRLQEHNDIFGQASDMRRAFQDAKKSAGRGLPAEQLADIERRLNQVQQNEPEVRQKLEFLESKYRVLAYFIVTERKLPEWTGSYGHLPEVEALLADYEQFVVAGKLLPSVDQALDAFRQRAEALKKRDSGKAMPETKESDRFATEATRKWDRLRREVQAVPEPLKRVAESWKQFLEDAEALESWLPAAQQALRGSAEQRDSFFADLANWEARHRRLNEAGGLLSQNCAPPAADEVRQRLQRINRQWKDLSEGHKQTERMDAAERNRRDYHASTSTLTDWLDRAEQLVEAELPCSVRCIRDNLASLQATQEQQEPMETEFKTVSKTAQSMVKDLPEQTVNEMLGNLKVIKERLQNLRKKIPERSRGLKGVLPNVESLENGLEELVNWIEAGERLLAQHGGDSDDKSIEEKMEAHKTHFGQANYFKSVLDGKNRFLGKIKSAKVKNLNTDEVDAQFEDLNRRFKELLSRAEQEAQDLQAAQSSLKLAKDWLRSAGDRLEPLTSTESNGGDKASLASRLDRLNDLINSEAEGAARIQAAMEAVRRAMAGASPAQRAKLQAELDDLQRAWDAHRERAQQAKADLEDTLERLGQAEALETDLASRLAEMESRGREAGGAKNSLDEKRDQVEKLQQLLDDLQAIEPDFGRLDSNSQPQLQSRLRSLAKATEAAAEKAATAAADHEAYQQELEQLVADIDELEDEARDLDSAGTAGDLEAKQRLAEELAQRRGELYTKLQSLNAAAEKVCSASGAPGRDRVRGEVRELKNRLDGLVDQLTTRRKQLEQSANQWRGLGEQLDQMSAWLQDKQAELDSCTQPRDTLEDKKEQLINARGLHNEVAAFGKRVQSAEDRLRGMAGQGLSASADQERQLDEIKFAHESLLAAAKQAAAEADEAVREHAEFKEACSDTGNWISGLGERLAVCSDLTGDRQALQSRLDRLERRIDLAKAQAEGEQRLDKIDNLAEAVCRHTGSSGVDAIRAEAGDLRVEWTDFVDSVEQAKRDLTDCADRWAEYEDANKLCAEHIRAAEAHLKAAEPCPTVEEKSALADRLNDAAAWAADVAERDFNGRLHEAAADLAKSSREGHVTGQAASLASRFALLRDQLSDQAAAWRGHADEHAQLDRDLADTDDWLVDFEDRLARCGDGRGDRFEVQARLATLGELNAEREDGFRRLAALQDRLQSSVLPATSGAGRDRLRQAAQRLQDRWDSCLAELGRSRQQLDGALAQWTLYEEGSDQVERWLRDYRAQLDAEPQDGSASSLADKRSQAERLHNLQTALRGHQPAVRALADKAAAMLETQDPSEATDGVMKMVKEFELLDAEVAGRLRDADRRLRDHQQYKEALADASEWLETSRDRLTADDQLRTDRQSLDARAQLLRDTIDGRPVGDEKIRRAEERGRLAAEGCDPAGRRQIEEETAALVKAMKDLMAECQAQSGQVTGLNKRWSDFDAQLDSLNAWLTDREARVRHEPGVDLDDKRRLAAAQESLETEIAGKQVELEALSELSADLLQDSGVDLRVSTQLAKTGARYHALEALAREHAQKLRAHADDHAEFERNADEADRWIGDATERLAAAGRESGEADKYDLQRQLDRVNDLALIKEEGQVLLQAAGHWADKAEQNTAPKGRPAIRDRLADLQRRWEAFTRDLHDARAALDKRQMEWAEHDDTVEGVQRWLADQSSRLRDQPLPADLAEKRAAAQRAREAQQAIAAYRPVLESAAAGCRRLGQTADKLLTDYDALVQLSADAATDAENVQERHQRYQQVAADTATWLRQRREQLAGLSSTSGPKDAEAASRDLATAKSAKAELDGDGEERLRRLRQLADDAMEATSAAGQSRLRQEVASVGADLDDLRQSAGDAVGRLERSVNAWRELDDRSAAFDKWLAKDVEVQIDKQQLDDDADAKRRRAEEAQRRYASIASPDRLAELETIADRAQTLGCSQRAKQLAARHQVACRAAADAARQCAARWQAHADLDASLGDLEQWLAAVDDRLGAAGGDAERLAELLTQLEAGRGRLRSASELADRVLPDTGRAGQERIRARLAAIRDSFDKAAGATAEARTRAEATLGAARECRHAAGELEAWLTDAEARASTAGALVPVGSLSKSSSKKPADAASAEQQQLEERKSALERLRALAKEVDAKSGAFARLAERAAAAAGSSGLAAAGGEAQLAREAADSLGRRYARLQASLATRVSDLETAVSGQEEFSLAAQRAAAWLAQAQTRLARASDLTGGRADLEGRLELAETLRTEANREGQSLVDKAAAAGEYLARNRPSAAASSDAVAQLRRELATLLAGVDDAEARLGRGVEQWRGFSDGCQRFADWLQDAESRLRRGPEPSVSLETKQRQARDFQVIQEEINNRKTDLEKLQSLGDQLEKTTRSPQISTRLLQLSSKYQNLLAQCTDLLEEANQKLQQVTKDTKTFEDARDDAKQWIELATQRLLGCSNFSEDPRRLAEKKRTVKDIADSMLDGENKLAAMLEAGERVLRSGDNPDRVRRQMDDIRQDFNALRKQLQQVQAGVEKSAAKWSDFQDVSQRLGSWLSEAERSLGQLGSSRADFGERRAMQDRLRSLKNEVDRCEPDFEDLQQLCDQLTSVGKQPEVEAETKSLKNRYYQLRKAVNAKLDELNKAQKEHQTYQDSLQECEKWILQTSFRLMEQNSAQCPSLEEAQRQLDQHNSVCREIDDHQQSIENVRRLGRRLIEENSGNYELRSEIEGQLSALDESYANLKETAQQITDRLTDNQQRWKAYRDVLIAADRYLHSDLVSWWSGREPLNVRTADEARQQTEDTRAVQSRLTQLRSDIVNAALKCDCTSPGVVGASAAAAAAASARRRYSGGSGSQYDGGASRRSPSPLIGAATSSAGSSEINRLAEKVSRDLQSNLDRIDRRLAELSFRRDSLERVDAEAEDAADWLRDREAEANALQDASALERLRSEVANRSFSAGLLEARPDLRAQRDALLRKLDAALAQRRQAQEAEAEYRRRQAALDSEVDSVMRRVDNRTTASAQTLDQVDYLRLTDQQTQTPCHQQTQTPKQSNTPSTSALDLTDGRLYGPGHGYPGHHHHHHHHPLAPSGSSLDLRNSGGGVGISKKLWPYTRESVGKDGEDPLVALQRTLTDLESREEVAVQTPKHRRTQTSSASPSSIAGSSSGGGGVGGKPMRGVALLHIIDTVKGLQDDLAARRSREDAAASVVQSSPSAPTKSSSTANSAESIRRPAERPLGLSEDNRAVGSLRARSLPRQRPTAASVAPAAAATPLTTPKRARSPSPPRRQQPPPPPPIPQPLIGGVENRYGLSADKFDKFIPTRPHWRSEDPVLLRSNGHLEPTPPPPPPPPQPAFDSRRFIRDYNQMLMEPGNQKQPVKQQQQQQQQQQQRNLKDSLGRAARTAQDMREATNRMRKSAAV